MQVSRLLLITAAFLATISVGVAMMRSQPGDVPPDAAGAPVADTNSVIAGIEEKLKTNPGDARGWKQLALTFYQAGRFAESATAYERGAKLSPDDAESWSNLGEALVMANQESFPSSAKIAFDKALALDPKDVRARYFLAVEKDRSGKHVAAIDDWFALLRDSPPDAPWQADVRALIATVAAKEKIDVSARMAALRGSAAPIKSAEVQQSAMVQSMVDGLAKKLATNPDDVGGWVMLIRSYNALGRTADAQAARQKALAANPDSAAELNAASAKLPAN